jgi:hypothetical protein
MDCPKAHDHVLRSHLLQGLLDEMALQENSDRRSIHHKSRTETFGCRNELLDDKQAVRQAPSATQVARYLERGGAAPLHDGFTCIHQVGGHLADTPLRIRLVLLTQQNCEFPRTRRFDGKRPTPKTRYLSSVSQGSYSSPDSRDAQVEVLRNLANGHLLFLLHECAYALKTSGGATVSFMGRSILRGCMHE